jgi:predicted cupin superfamily sugar epimerase/mannose-6-phosphate isomerase-like protein (cupin superfamily)
MKKVLIALALTATGCLAVASSAHAGATVPDGMAGKLIRRYHMQPIPLEGPWFSLTYTSEDTLEAAALPARYGGRPHAAGSAIVVVETPREFSAMHRLRTDEVWHFYDGSPLDLLLLYPDGHGRKITLGADVLAGELRQFTVPHFVWQGSAPRHTSAGTYSFVADQLSPAFDNADFQMGYRDQLQHEYPAFAKDIERLTRVEFAFSTAEPPGQAEPPEQAEQKPKAVAFGSAQIPVQSASPGVGLRELVGQQATSARTSRLSVAQFTLAPGRSSGTSHNRLSQEVFLITSGSGRVHLEASAVPVGPGSTVFIPAQKPHSIEADSSNTLIFFAISAPAFTAEDYVLDKP